MKNLVKILVIVVALIIFIVSLICIICGLYFREFTIIPWSLIGFILSPIFVFRPGVITATPAFINKLLGREELQKKPKDEDMISMPKKYLEDVVEEKHQYKKAVNEIVEIVKNKEQSIQELKNELQKSAELIKQYFWKSEINEFKYLDYFFVYNTKRILAWIVYKKQVVMDEFYKQVFFFGIKVDNINTILNVLIDFYMIKIENGIIYPTARSKAFLSFINFKYPDFRTIAEIIGKITPPKPPTK